MGKLIKVIRGGEITIPKSYRDKFDVQTDDYFSAEYDGKKIILILQK
jgi:bifunctional DNA-binding transcriptional regulator/antitoxin component of YhaV-PrlF toxin-antitoxin module